MRLLSEELLALIRSWGAVTDARPDIAFQPLSFKELIEIFLMLRDVDITYGEGGEK